MITSMKHTRWLAGLLAAVLLFTTVTPAAFADNGRKRYKGNKHSKQRYERVVKRHESPYRSYGRGDHSRSVYVVRRSSAGPAIAGFLGGLFLGATLAHAAPAGYYYDDPYCHQRFASLELYRGHLHRHDHPRIVRVINIDSGDCVRTGRYHDGRWVVSDHDDWDDRYYDEDY